VKETINKRVRRVRNSLDMTQSGFSRVLSLSGGYLAGVETGKRKVNDRLVKLICTSFKVNEEWLRTGNGEIFSEKIDESFIKLVSFFKELTPKYREYLLGEIKLLLEIQARETK
jgi:transcriptional regulator with XRE-family HTH domain